MSNSAELILLDFAKENPQVRGICKAKNYERQVSYYLISTERTASTTFHNRLTDLGKLVLTTTSIDCELLDLPIEPKEIEELPAFKVEEWIYKKVA